MSFIKTSICLFFFSATSLFAQNNFKDMIQRPDTKVDTFRGVDTLQKQRADSIALQAKYNERIKEVILRGSRCTSKNILSKNDYDSLKNIIIPDKLDTIQAADKNNSNIKALALTYFGCHSKKDQNVDRVLYDTASNTKINDTIRVGAVRGLEISSTPTSTSNLIKLNDTINKHFSFGRGNIDAIDSLTGESRIEAESLVSLGNKAYTGKREQSAHAYLTTVMKADSRTAHRVSRWNAALVLGENADPSAGSYLANIATGSDYGKNTESELSIRQDAAKIIEKNYSYLIKEEMDKNGSVVKKINGRPYYTEKLKKEIESMDKMQSAIVFVALWVASDGALSLLAEWGPVVRVLESLQKSFTTVEEAAALAKTESTLGRVIGETEEGLGTSLTTAKRITSQAVGSGRAPLLNTTEYNSWVNGMNAKQLTTIDNTVSRYGVTLDDGLKQSLLDAHKAGGLSGADKVTKLREFSNLKKYLMENKGLSEADAKQFILDLADKDVMVLGTPPTETTVATGAGAGEKKSAEELMKSYESPFISWDESKSVPLMKTTNAVRKVQINTANYNKELMKNLVKNDQSVEEFFNWNNDINHYVETNRTNLVELQNTRNGLDKRVEDLSSTIDQLEKLKYDNSMFDRSSYEAYIASLRKQLETSTANSKKALDTAISNFNK